ncbi:formin-like protein 5 [Camelus ferus]|uniref:Formin-like protein 5 n=1 Tax=Camelus ferus TaxID=419612 RepID=A0A8B8T9Q4_CAMFR|nr:formin-like protein 5 [Camelus ferus]
MLRCEQFWRRPCGWEGAREPGGGEGAGGRSVPAPGPERVSEGPGLAPTQAGGARGGGRRRASNRKCTACSAALPLPPPPHAAPGPPRTAARRAGGGSSPLLSPPLPSPSPWPRRRGTRTQMISDSPRSPASVYPCPPKTRTRALGPADPAAAEARVSVGCASTRTCLSGNRGPRGPPAGMRTRMRTELPVSRAECGFSPPPHRTNPTRLLSGSPRDPRPEWSQTEDPPSWRSAFWTESAVLWRGPHLGSKPKWPPHPTGVEFLALTIF